MIKVRTIILGVLLVFSYIIMFSNEAKLNERVVTPHGNKYKLIDSMSGKIYEWKIDIDLETIKVFIDKKTSVPTSHCPVDWIYIWNLPGKQERVSAVGINICLTIL